MTGGVTGVGGLVMLVCQSLLLTPGTETGGHHLPLVLPSNLTASSLPTVSLQSPATQTVRSRLRPTPQTGWLALVRLCQYY